MSACLLATSAPQMAARVGCRRFRAIPRRVFWHGEPDGCCAWGDGISPPGNISARKHECWPRWRHPAPRYIERTMSRTHLSLAFGASTHQRMLARLARRELDPYQGEKGISYQGTQHHAWSRRRCPGHDGHATAAAHREPCLRKRPPSPTEGRRRRREEVI